jgi:hypothetical protein
MRLAYALRARSAIEARQASEAALQVDRKFFEDGRHGACRER